MNLIYKDYSAERTALSYDDQLWLFAMIRGRRLVAELPLTGVTPNERILHDLFSMGTFDWAGIHRPDASTTRAMRYAAALMDTQRQSLHTANYKVPLSPLAILLAG